MSESAGARLIFNKINEQSAMTHKGQMNHSDIGKKAFMIYYIRTLSKRFISILVRSS